MFLDGEPLHPFTCVVTACSQLRTLGVVTSIKNVQQVWVSLNEKLRDSGLFTVKSYTDCDRSSSESHVYLNAVCSSAQSLSLSLSLSVSRSLSLGWILPKHYLNKLASLTKPGQAQPSPSFPPLPPPVCLSLQWHESVGQMSFTEVWTSSLARTCFWMHGNFQETGRNTESSQSWTMQALSLESSPTPIPRDLRQSWDQYMTPQHITIFGYFSIREAVTYNPFVLLQKRLTLFHVITHRDYTRTVRRECKWAELME